MEKNERMKAMRDWCERRGIDPDAVALLGWDELRRELGVEDENTALEQLQGAVERAEIEFGSPNRTFTLSSERYEAFIDGVFYCEADDGQSNPSPQRAMDRLIDWFSQQEDTMKAMMIQSPGARRWSIGWNVMSKWGKGHMLPVMIIDALLLWATKCERSDDRYLEMSRGFILGNRVLDYIESCTEEERVALTKNWSWLAEFNVPDDEDVATYKIGDR